jgi:hypothetical protein
MAETSTKFLAKAALIPLAALWCYFQKLNKMAL